MNLSYSKLDVELLDPVMVEAGFEIVVDELDCKLDLEEESCSLVLTAVSA